MDHTFCDRNFLCITSLWVGMANKVGLLNVYAPQSSSLKEALWSSIESLVTSINDVWVIFGDFNVVRSRDERSGCKFDMSEANVFNDFISRLELFAFHLGGRRFTRFDQEGRKASKLDRFMVSPEFFDLWKDAHVKNQTLPSSSPLFSLDILLKNKLKRLRLAIKSWSSKQ
ncbi:RNA-directed DNA polymerase, eukaryota, partial [Tanacetum coccineum]